MATQKTSGGRKGARTKSTATPSMTSKTNRKAPSRRAARDLPQVVEGDLVVSRGARFAIVAARFNAFIVESLVGGALDALVRHGASRDEITVVRVPGAWEIPVVVRRLAESGHFDAVVALGAVIRGGTPHFDYVAGEVSKGVAQASMQSDTVVTFGVLTTDTIEQAVERAGTKAGNKGAEAALAAVEMVSLSARLGAAGL